MKEIEGIARRLLPIIYVLDTSGSMDGSRIAAVNNAMGETIEVLKELGEENADADMKVGVLRFSSGAEWVTKGLVYPDDFYWQDLTAGGAADLGAALEELNKSLSEKAFLNSPLGCKCPIIVFMSVGQPTDDYEKALMNINAENAWFRAAFKLSLSLDDAAGADVLATVCGVYKQETEKIIPNKKAVFTTQKVQSVRQLTANLFMSPVRWIPYMADLEEKKEAQPVFELDLSVLCASLEEELSEEYDDFSWEDEFV